MTAIDLALSNAALNAAGAQDTQAQIDHNDESYRRYFNLHFETYGREVVLQTKNGTGDPLDDNVSRADAIDIATRIKPFAVVVGAPYGVTAVFVGELAARGVICVCVQVGSRAIYARMKGYAWPSNTDYPTADTQFIHTAEYIGKRLGNRPAQFAGDLPVGIKGANRKFGLIAETHALLAEAEETLRRWADVAEQAWRDGRDIADALSKEFDADLDRVEPALREKLETLNGIHSNAAGFRRWLDTRAETAHGHPH